MDLPYSVIRGEQVAIKVIVFNYENEDMEVRRLTTFYHSCSSSELLLNRLCHRSMQIPCYPMFKLQCMMVKILSTFKIKLISKKSDSVSKYDILELT